METYKVTVDEYGTIRWRNEDGQFHRLDGPAVESTNGDKFWHKNGRLHCLDGPAIEWSNGNKLWYIEDVKYTEEAFNTKIKTTCEGKTVEVDGIKYKLVKE